MEKGPISDPNSFFAAVDPSDTHSVMEKLRANKIEFSVSVNPEPEEDEGDSDVFWFSTNADIGKIQGLINEGMKKT